MEIQKRFKVLMVGDSQVGKTSLLDLYKNKKVNLKPIPTIGCDYVSFHKNYEN